MVLSHLTKLSVLYKSSKGSLSSTKPSLQPQSYAFNISLGKKIFNYVKEVNSNIKISEELCNNVLSPEIRKVYNVLTREMP